MSCVGRDGSKMWKQVVWERLEVRYCVGRTGEGLEVRRGLCGRGYVDSLLQGPRGHPYLHGNHHSGVHSSHASGHLSSFLKLGLLLHGKSLALALALALASTPSPSPSPS